MFMSIIVIVTVWAVGLPWFVISAELMVPMGMKRKKQYKDGMTDIVVTLAVMNESAIRHPPTRLR